MRAQSARASAGSSRKKSASRARPPGEARSSTRARQAEAPPVAGPRPSPKRTVISTMKELPNFLRLIGGLLTDVRVSTTDKLLVAGAIGYVFLPMDFVPDFVPFIGEIDDVFLLVLALQRLIANTGRWCSSTGWAIRSSFAHWTWSVCWWQPRSSCRVGCGGGSGRLGGTSRAAPFLVRAASSNWT